MKAGFVSDSHGHFENLKKTGELMVKKHNVDLIIHLGDDSHEADVLKELNVELLKVPGVYEGCYQSKEVSNRVIKELEGWKCFFTHTIESHKNDLEDDIKPEDVIKEKKADIVFYGHSHIPAIEERDGVLLINPGHLKDEDKKGYSPSYGVIDFSSEKIKIEIIELKKGNTIKSMELSR